MEFQVGPSVYEIVNTALRSEDRAKVKPFASYLRLLLGALHKLPKVVTVLHRGVVADLGAEYNQSLGRKVGEWLLWLLFVKLVIAFIQ